ncbi:unnamed protein product [Clonostachys solani]|uniref:Isoleucine--tRNA ligase, mitochondrial n=1 Tax=Clonostachys solani TaxID=160281 RepID=A0A9N9ZJY3_9HYPO|nr:unnamed protein product [Clonostachys solani]
MSKSWKATLKLPVSKFPARPNPKLQAQYLRQCTDDLYAWQAANRPADDPFILHDGPPYANGPLHIGHAINKIVKDMIVRTRLQQGRRIIYRPGWDCHGLPIEMKALGSGNGKGMSPVKIRDQAKRLASKTVTEQMKGFRSFAVLADWENKWTTMDPDYELRQLQVFQELVRRGLIYRKRKPIYWSISSRTALAEAELEYKDDHKSTCAYVKYPIVSDWTHLPGTAQLQGPLHAAIWTTTPWTLPANKAIAVHEDLAYAIIQADGYGLIVAENLIEQIQSRIPATTVLAQGILGSHLRGLEYRNRLQGPSGAPQPIIHGDFVTADSGTGLVHVAPGHGQEDYEACSELGIEAFAPITDEGHFTKQAFPEDPERLVSAPSILDGGSRAVLDILADDVLTTHVISHKYPYDWRTKQPVVTRATSQWFADVGSIKDDALEALKSVHFIPQTGRNRLENFVKGRSEWCISRQRAWGVPIPALYDSEGNSVMTVESIDHILSTMRQRGSQAWFSDAPDDPAWVAPSLQGTFRRGTDTMDVWFDSGSSWTETPQQADVYLEGSDQHRGWFQSSLLTYIATRKPQTTLASSSSGLWQDAAVGGIRAPFKTLITHGFTLDDKGKKMSKSLGNTISPEEVMNGSLLPPIKGKGKSEPRPDALGPDALRVLAATSDYTTDMAIGSSVLKPVHTTLLKYRSILKMLTGSLHESSRQAPLSKLDHIAFMQLTETMSRVLSAFDQYEFHRGTQIINHWISTELSAFYLESLKDRLYCGDGGGIIEPIFIGLLRMLAPVTPLLVEESWAHRPQWMADDNSLEHPARQNFNSPLIDPSRIELDENTLRGDWSIIAPIRESVKYALEQARESKDIGSSLQCQVIVQTTNEQVKSCLERYRDELDSLFNVSSVEINAPLPQDPVWIYQHAFEQDDWNGSVHVVPPTESKCSRCWRYLAEEEDGLCKRCDDVVAKLP